MEVQQDQHPMANAFQLDDTVQLVGLVKAELDGAQGTICERTLPGARIMVKLEDGSIKAIQECKLQRQASNWGRARQGKWCHMLGLHCFALICIALLCIA